MKETFMSRAKKDLSEINKIIKDNGFCYWILNDEQKLERQNLATLIDSAIYKKNNNDLLRIYQDYSKKFTIFSKLVIGKTIKDIIDDTLNLIYNDKLICSGIDIEEINNQKYNEMQGKVVRGTSTVGAMISGFAIGCSFGPIGAVGGLALGAGLGISLGVTLSNGLNAQEGVKRLSAKTEQGIDEVKKEIKAATDKVDKAANQCCSMGKGAVSLTSGLMAGGVALFAHTISDNLGYSDAVTIAKVGFFGVSALLTTAGTFEIIKNFKSDEKQDATLKVQKM